MAGAVDACVHCGFCLAACPTYLTLGNELDSPRGRIVLMKGVLEDELSLDEVLPHVDRCLGCLGCVSACPSGVQYGELLIPFREKVEKERTRSLMERLTRWMIGMTLPYPARFRAGAILGRFGKPFSALLPRSMRAMLELLPSSLPTPYRVPAKVAAEGERRGKVALLAGCAQQVLAPGINRSTVAVLARNGVEIVTPPEQGCCGALALHTGEADSARALARRNLEAFTLGEVDALITNAAGCGSGIHDYPLLFAGKAEEERAKALTAKTQDISAYLAKLGVAKAPPLSRELVVAYHDACHLAHAQGVRAAPRTLLSAIPGVKLVPIPDGEICCGSAGSYNIEQPDIADQLGRRKAEAVLSTGAEVIVTGNIGCSTQIQTHLRKLGRPLRVMHTVELLDWAYRGGSWAELESS
jgi:glycolate oxidase iron-sulfur subunit